MPDDVNLLVTCDYPEKDVSRIIYKAWKEFRDKHR